MRRLKLNRALWGLNALLATALLAFVGRYLVAPPRVDRLRDVDPSAASSSPPRPRPAPASEEALIHLHNPLRKPEGPNPSPPFEAILKGALPTSQSGNGVAFIRSSSSQTETIARVGEEILRNGKPAPEFAGWILSELGRDLAVFENRLGERFVLRIEPVLTAPSDEERRPPSRQGEAYRPELYRSRLLASTDAREIWGIDAGELDWAAQNSPQVLNQDAQISPCAGGGMRIDTLNSGSMAAARGLKPGDILREVNGRPLRSLGDLQSVFSDPPKSVLQLTLERAGKPIVLEYRALPR
jgi:hypothetical protein